MTPATQILLFGKPFRIADYFRMGQIGWHWQFDDPLKRVGIPYEWTDTAGTTPTTAVGQGIGLLLGREYGGATGPSLLANGTTGLTGTATAASYNTSTFAGSVSRAGDASNQSWVTWTGLTTSAVYRIRITNTGATSLDVRNGGVAGTIVASIAAGASTWVHPATTGGSTSITITATSNSTTATFTLGQFAVLPGTHLTQATGTAKPTLSARVNGFVGTEGAFSGASWTKVGSPTITLTAGAGPRGESADLISNLNTLGVGTSYFFNANFSTALSGASVGSSYVPRIQIKRVSTSGTVTITNPSTAANGQWNINLALLSDSWEVITATHAAVTVVAPFSVAIAGQAGILFSASATGVQFYCTQADVRTADDASKNIPAYQRVGATATDHDTDGFPHYALHDGTDDAWASVATVDGSSTDKVSFVAAVTKSSDAADGTILAFGDPSAGDAGSFIMQAPGSSAVTKLQFSSRGTTQAVPFTASTTYNAPITMVAGAVADIGSPLAQLSINGVTVSTITTTQGGGNYNSAKSVSVGQRIGGTARFNGRFYGSTGRFGPMGDSERNNLTRWWQKRIGTA